MDDLQKLFLSRVAFDATEEQAQSQWNQLKAIAALIAPAKPALDATLFNLRRDSAGKIEKVSFDANGDVKTELKFNPESAALKEVTLHEDGTMT